MANILFLFTKLRGESELERKGGCKERTRQKETDRQTEDLKHLCQILSTQNYSDSVYSYAGFQTESQ